VEIRKARGVGVPGARRVECPVSSLTPTTRAEGRAHEAPTPIAQDAQPATIVDASQKAEARTKRKARWEAQPLAQIFAGAASFLLNISGKLR
jgi:hypothetical protein